MFYILILKNIMSKIAALKQDDKNALKKRTNHKSKTIILYYT